MDETVSQWFTAPEFADFQALPTEDKRLVLGNYFESSVAPTSSEFMALPEERRAVARDSFVNQSLSTFQPHPSRGAVADIGVAALRSAGNLAKTVTQGVAAVADGLGSPEVYDKAMDVAQTIGDRVNDRFPTSQEEEKSYLRRTMTGATSGVLESLGAGLPGAGIGFLASGGNPAGAVVGYLMGAPMFGLSQYAEAKRRYIEAGYSPEDATTPATLEGIAVGASQELTSIVDLLGFGAAHGLSLAGKEALSQGLAKALTVSWGEVAKDAALKGAVATAGLVGGAGATAEVQKEWGVGTQGFWEAVREQLGPAGVASVLLTGIHGAAGKISADRTLQKTLGDPIPDLGARDLGPVTDSTNLVEAGTMPAVRLDAESQSLLRKRAEKVLEVTNIIREQGGRDMAKIWFQNAMQAVANNEPIDLVSSVWLDAKAALPSADPGTPMLSGPAAVTETGKQPGVDRAQAEQRAAADRAQVDMLQQAVANERQRLATVTPAEPSPQEAGTAVLPGSQAPAVAELEAQLSPGQQQAVKGALQQIFTTVPRDQVMEAVAQRFPAADPVGQYARGYAAMVTGAGPEPAAVSPAPSQTPEPTTPATPAPAAPDQGQAPLPDAESIIAAAQADLEAQAQANRAREAEAQARAQAEAAQRAQAFAELQANPGQAGSGPAAATQSTENRDAQSTDPRQVQPQDHQEEPTPAAPQEGRPAAAHADAAGPGPGQDAQGLLGGDRLPVSHTGVGETQASLASTDETQGESPAPRLAAANSGEAAPVAPPAPAAGDSSTSIAPPAADDQGLAAKVAAAGKSPARGLFVRSPSGSLDFGEIGPEVAERSAGKFPPGPIRLERGVPGKDGYGAGHIDPARVDEFRAVGYDNALDALHDVAQHYTSVYAQPNGRLLLVKVNGRKRYAAVELQKKADGYYGVTTWFLEDGKPKGGKPYEERGGRELLAHVSRATDAGSPAPFVATSTDAGLVGTDDRASSSLADTIAPPAADGNRSAKVAAANKAPTLKGKAAAAPTGGDGTAYTEAGQAIDFRYRILPAAELVTSHTDTFHPHPDFPAELQPRDRDRDGYRVQVEAMANGLQPERLAINPSVGAGAPMVDEAGVVESGNGRSLAIRKAYALGKAEDYRRYLVEHAADFGMTPAQVAQVKNPVLVRERTTELTPAARLDFVRQANESGVARMSLVEQAKVDAARLDSLDRFVPNDRGEVATSANRDFIAHFIDSVVAPGERTMMLAADGSLSQEGRRRVQAAIFAKAYDQPGLMSQVLETTDPGLANLGAALLQVAPEVAKLKIDMAAGRLYDVDIPRTIAEASEHLARLKAEGRPVASALRQISLFGDGYSPEVAAVIAGLNEILRSRPKLVAMIRDAISQVQALGSPKQTKLFSDEVDIPAQVQVFNRAMSRLREERSGTEQSNLDFGETEGGGPGPARVAAGAQDMEPGPHGGGSDAGRGGNDAGPGGSGRAAGGREVGPDGERFAGNRIFTADKVAAARARFAEKLGRLQSGFDPEMLYDGTIIAGAHIESGLRSFADFARAMVADLGQEVKPYLKYLYNGVRDFPGAEHLASGMDTYEAVRATDLDRIFSQQEHSHEHDSNRGADLERDSQPAASGHAVGDQGLPDGRRPDSRDGEPGVSPPGEPGPGSQRDLGVAAYEAAAAGERGDFSPYSESEQPGHAELPAGGDDSWRGGDAGRPGVQTESIARGTVVNAAESSGDRELRLSQQARAQGVKVIPGDRANIDQSLPALYPGQRDDVAFAERRFGQPAGYGVMFTNGTGTGKTFTALGVIKRYERQGKDNVLIVAPQDGIIKAFVAAGRALQLTITPLADTTTPGQSGIVITTYANLGQNNSLANRQWDLVVADEAHYLKQAKDGGDTLALNALRAITLHPRGAFTRYTMLHSEELAEQKAIQERLTANRKIANNDDTMDQVRQDLAKENAALEQRFTALTAKLKADRERIRAEVAAAQGAGRTRVLLLSATPFAYEKAVDLAEGYLFDYPSVSGSSYNSGGGLERFMMQHFGYRMRYNKLTEPEAGVDRGLMQRTFNSWLKKEKVLSGRMLDVDQDYDRKFVLTKSAVGAKIDEGLDWLWKTERMRPLWQLIQDKFDHLTRRYLLEAIKAKEVVPLVQEHLDLGRKVVVFHDFKKGGGFNPFNLDHLRQSQTVVELGQDKSVMLGDLVREYRELRPDLADFPLAAMPRPIDTLLQAFPDLLLYNGDISKQERAAAVAAFQDDDSGRHLILVQSAAGKEGISLHDSTGRFPRVLFNLGLPTQPTTAIQQEGRIYRTGQASNAMFRYLNTGTNWERWAFATTIANRASTAENLALGEQARALRDAYIQGFEESDHYPAGFPGEGTGGQERDAAANAALSDWDRAMALYYAQQKKTARTKAAEGKDYFATPEPLGLKMVEWAGIRPGDEALEPSAGHGAIARWLPENIRRTVVEPSPELASRLKMVTDAKLLQERFEDLHTGANKFDVVVMNPPFGSGGRTAIDHLDKAVRHLRPEGRVVALIPSGPAADAKFERWFEGTEGVHLAADIKLPTITFERAGTGVATRIVILDRVAGHSGDYAGRDWSAVKTVKELFHRIENASLPARPAKAERETTGAGPEFRLAQTRHAKKGIDLYVASLTTRVERGEYERLNGLAQAQGGHFSAYKAQGAVPGFQFESAAARDRFLAAAGVAADEPKFSRPGGEPGLDSPQENPVQGGYEPGQSTARTKELTGKLNRYFTDHGLDPLRPGDLTEVQVPESVGGATAREVARYFGKELTFLHNQARERIPFNGLVFAKSLPHDIFIDAATPNPALAITGHELVHLLQRDAPDLYQQLVAGLAPLMRDVGHYRDQVLAKTMSAEEQRRFQDDWVRDELIGDFVGDRFIEPEFWRSLAARMGKSFRQVARRVLDFLDGLLAWGRKKGLGSDRYFSDLARGREVVAEVLARYSLRQAGADGYQGLHSKLARVVATAFEPMKAQGVENFLGRHGVRAEEMQALGVKEWLASQGPQTRIRRQDLVDFVKAQAVTTEEVVLGPVPSRAGYITSLPNGSFRVEFPGLQRESFPTRAAAAERLASLQEKFARDETRFGNYTEPGAVPGSYRELFVTAPMPQSRRFAELKEKFDRTATLTLAEREEYLSLGPGTHDPALAMGNWRDGHAQYAGIANPIVRLRFNERPGPLGERVLFIEEMQGPSATEQAKMPGYLKDNIYPVGVKRALAYAKENGFDGVAWTPGRMQAGRYDLARSIEEIHYTGSDLAAYGPGGEEVVRTTGVRPDDLAGYVGKDNAQRLMAQPVKRGVRSLVGDDLAGVGGEGLMRLYDQDLPRLFAAYGRQPVSEMKIPGMYQIRHDPELNDWSASPSGPRFADREQAEAWALAQSGRVHYLAVADALPDSFPLFSRAPVERPPSPVQVAHDHEQDRSFANRLFEQRDLGVFTARVTAQGLQKRVQALAGEASRRKRNPLGLAYDPNHKRSEASDRLDQALLVYRDLKNRPQAAAEFRAWAAERLADSRQPHSERDQVRRQLDTLEQAEHLSDEQQALAAEIGDMFDAAHRVAQANKVVQGFRENYVRRMWDFTNEPTPGGSWGGFKTATSARLQRKLDTVLDGWMRGYDLKVKGLTNSLGHYLAELEEVLANKDFLVQGREMRDAEGRRLFSTSNRGDYSDYRPLKAPGFAVWEYAGEAKTAVDDELAPQALFTDGSGRKFFWGAVERLPERYAVYSENAPGRALKVFTDQAAAARWAAERQVATRIETRPALDVSQAFEKRQLYAPPGIADLINRMTAQDTLFAGIPGAQALLDFNARIKGWILLSSFFHHLAGARSWMFGIEHGGKNEWLPNPLDPQGPPIATGGLNPVRAYKLGYAMIEGLHPLVKLGVRHGLTIGEIQDFNEPKSERQALALTLAQQMGMVRSARAMEQAGHWKETFTDSLFKRYFAGLKAQAFAVQYIRELQREQAKDPGGRVDTERLAERVAFLVNSDFGGLHLRRMGRHPTIQKLLRLSLLAPDWTESNWQAVTGMIPGLNERIAKLLGEIGPPPNMDRMYRRFWGRAAMRIVLSTLMLQLLLNGLDWDKLYREQLAPGVWRKFRWLEVDISKLYDLLGVDRQDKRKTLSLGGHFLDPVKILDPFRLISGKASPLGRGAAALMTGRDWADRPYTGTAELLASGSTIKASPYTQTEDGLDRLPSVLANQAVNSLPIQAGYLFKMWAGEEDALTSLLQSTGLAVHNAWPPPLTRPIATQDAQVGELLDRLQKAEALTLGPPGKTVTSDGQTVRLEDADYDELVAKSSSLAERKLKRLMTMPRWSEMSDEAKAELVETVVKSSRKQVRSDLKRRLKRDGEL